jgi:hypothetical protein
MVKNNTKRHKQKAVDNPVHNPCIKKAQRG